MSDVRFGSICSGIEAASAAWLPLGWECAWVSEIEPFPCAVLSQHYPTVPNLGDITAGNFIEHSRAAGPIDVLIGGTPCQSFSVAGLRGGIEDSRGNLALRFMQLVDALRPAVVVWENVPGVLSSGGGRDFGAILGSLVECGYGWAYRILDAQYFGVAQRRRRVFVVGCLGGWAAAAEILSLRESLQGHPAPSREAGEGVAASLAKGAESGGTVGALTARRGQNSGIANDDVDAGTLISGAVASKWAKGTGGPAGDECYNLVTVTLETGQGGYSPDRPYIPEGMTVRRLTPRECERLQGFPDDYTQVTYRNKPAADGPRYRALGNSMAVPVVRWIGERRERCLM
jgi:DNA (cytosine-5)-methyltransferase 1